ncbi:MAG: hypothetical protein OIF57_17625 [Marinobacterium sp.]|nr:hypothetical protein [Marinobacterium sp.]
MASALNAQFYFEDAPYSYNHHSDLFENRCSEHAQQSMQQQKAVLQALLCEYYQLLLEEFGNNIPSDTQPAQTLNSLLEICQAWIDADLSPVASIKHPQHFRFWCQFHTTIHQYCQLQKRLLSFPASIEHWQYDRRHPT